MKMENSITQGDFLDLLPKIESGSVDAIITDPPYGTTKCKWDTEFSLPNMWTEFKRIIKPSGVIVSFAQPPFDKRLAMSNIEMFRYEWIWEKTQATGFLNVEKCPLKAHENILVFYSKQPTYNPQKTQGHSPVHTFTKRASVQNKTELYGKTSDDITGGGDTSRFPRDVLKFKTDKQINKSNGFIHPTQKPLELMRYLVLTYTNRSDIVVDPFAGSGTTCVAAMQEDRRYIGFDREQKYVDLSKRRLDAARDLFTT